MKVRTLITVLVILVLTVCCETACGDMASHNSAKDSAVQALLERFHDGEGIYVYDDFGSPCNHFTQKAKMWGISAEKVKDMDENWQLSPHSGLSCIRCEQETVFGDWGGWMFLNGYLPEGETVPRLNDGSMPGQGMDLGEARELRFWARGEEGGETVEFFTAGFGYDGEWGTPLVSYPDSAKKHSLGYVTLSDQWKEYVIELEGADLRYIICGFGFVLSGDRSGIGTKVFYLDDIRFVGGSTYPVPRPALLRSYDTDNIYIQNAAFVYDNAVAAMAFLSDGKPEAAARILDAFVYAVENDRWKPDRIRNAYAAGPIEAAPGWEGGASLPGWYDREAMSWYEDRYQTGSNPGNTSYVALALLQYDALYGNERYRNTAQTLMDWILTECSDDTPGFTAGYDGWPEAEPPVVYKFTYKSIEHNIDAYAAFKRLFELTGEKKYETAMNSALDFIRSMYDGESAYFYTGTGDDGVTPNKGIIVLDAISWNRMALAEAFDPYLDSMNTLAEMRVEEGGFPFSKGNGNGGWWPEGTAFTALMYRLFGDEETASDILDTLCAIQLQDGLFPAATVDKLPTGFEIFTGESWDYGSDPHITPTAWFIMAVNGFNPYHFN